MFSMKKKRLLALVSCVGILNLTILAGESAGAADLCFRRAVRKNTAKRNFIFSGGESFQRSS
jgi:hypothetical protein